MNDSDRMQLRAAALRVNQQCYDTLAAAKASLCRPASDEECANPLRTVDPLGWLGQSIAGKDVLCLAAGGGRQSALYASAKANVTVVDISPAMLELDRQVARERKLSIRAIQGSMDQLDILADGAFDIVIHPVSTCYLPDVSPVFREVSRVLRANGLYISQHKSPISLQSSAQIDSNSKYVIQHTYYRETPIPTATEANASSRRLREQGAVEYLHRLEQLIGGICRAGLVIEDLVEPVHGDEDAEPGSFGDRGRYIAPYLRMKARKVLPQAFRSPSFWIPVS
jgi:ubiquinone/menaquinone biosynthesis C-methylase UbiE